AHPHRPKPPTEPYLSKQWFVKMGDIEGGVVCGRGTANEFVGPGLAQAAIDAAQGTWRSPTGRQGAFHPDPGRYGNTSLQWLAEKRDWCISRQLWWGHRIPVWSHTFSSDVEYSCVMGEWLSGWNASPDIALFADEKSLTMHFCFRHDND